jgi:hypothetical protein
VSESRVAVQGGVGGCSGCEKSQRWRFDETGHTHARTHIHGARSTAEKGKDTRPPLEFTNK